MTEGGIDAREDVLEKFTRRNSRLPGFRLRAFFQFLVEKKKCFLEALHDPPPHKNVIGRDDVPEPIDPAANVAELLFFRMQFQPKFIMQKNPDAIAPQKKFIWIVREEKEIIHVAKVMADLELVLRELVQFIHVNICEKLRGQVANGEPLSSFNMKEGFVRRYEREEIGVSFPHEILQRIVKNGDRREPKEIGMMNTFLDQPEENVFLEAHEESLDIEMETVCRSAIVVREDAKGTLKIADSAARPPLRAARVGLMDEERLEDRGEKIVEQVMDYAVAERRGENLPHRRLCHDKANGTSRAVGAVDQLPLKPQKLRFRVLLEERGVVHLPLVPAAIEICLVEVLEAEDGLPSLSLSRVPGCNALENTGVFARVSIMRREHNHLRGILSLAALVVTALSLSSRVLASATDGTVDASSRYAWSENTGWIDFGSTEGNVHVTDTALSGYAWGENVGWISLNCSNDSSCATVDFKVTNDGAGTLGGYAWSENKGWIDFDPTGGGVVISSSGVFSGYAWGENVGWISFNCSDASSCATVDYKVSTDWRPSSARTTSSSSSSAQAQSGGGGGFRGSPSQMAARIAQARVTILARFEGKMQQSEKLAAAEKNGAGELKQEERAAQEREDRIAKRIAEHETAVALALQEKEDLQRKFDLHREERYARALALQEEHLAEQEAALLEQQQMLAAEQEANRVRRNERLTEQERRTEQQLLAEREAEIREEQAAKEREERIADRIAEHEASVALLTKERDELRRSLVRRREELIAQELASKQQQIVSEQNALLLEQQAMEQEQRANTQRREQRLAERKAQEQQEQASPQIPVTPRRPPSPEVIAARRGKLFALVGDVPVVFADVSLDEWYAPYVSYVVEEKIATGYADAAGKPKGEFGVANPITYAEVLKMALETAGSDMSGLPPPRNVSAKGTWASAYVAKAEDLSLVVFAPNLDVQKPATRGAVIQTLLEVLGITIGKTPATYEDVPKNHPHSTAIAAATFFGLVQGDLDAEGKPLNRFRPDDPINRAEVAKIIALAKELQK